MQSQRLVAALSIAALAAGLLLGQDGDFRKKEKKDKKARGDDETAKMLKLIEKTYKKSESERDRVIKELSKLAQEDIGNDPDRWFDLVAAGRPFWDRSTITQMGLAELFDRMAYRLEIDDARMPRASFVSYARRYWREGESPPWKEPKDHDPRLEAEKLFRHLDRDGDGRLANAEMPPALREDVTRWDRSGDGCIDAGEYMTYFGARLHRLDMEVRERVRPAPPPDPPEDDRPIVIRAGNLPAGIPAWFDVMDRNRDGQVGLDEWRRAAWELEEFAVLDINDDGLLTAEELLRRLAAVDRDGRRTFAYLLDRRLGDRAGTSDVRGKTKGDKKAKR